MEKVQRCGERKEAERKGRFFRSIGLILKSVGYYTWVAFSGMIFVLGLINLYDILIGDEVPEIRFVIKPNDAILRSHSDVNLCRNFDKDRAWIALQPALKLLRIVCPEASDWAEYQKKSNKIIWITQSDGTNARYDQIQDRLMINSDMFALSNAEIACTIAHEFRHSRQNMSKSWKSACSLLLTGNRNVNIIEDDAYFFEARIRQVINGW